MIRKIGIIGTGRVGVTLGLRLANLDYEVIYGSREPTSRKMLDILQQSSQNAKALDVKETIEISDFIILAIPWEKAESVIKSVTDWKNKVIVDCTNPLKSDLSGLLTEKGVSAAEQIAQWAKGADVVKAFNSIGTQVMDNPQFSTDQAALFICGDNEDNKEIVKHIGESLGFDVIDSGDLKASRYLEQLAMFWIHLAFNQGLGADFGLKILRRKL